MFGFIGIFVSVVFSLVLFYSSKACAVNPFNMGQVDYFHQKFQVNLTQQEPEDFDWSEGGVLPPEPMLALLRNPTLENAKAYVSWQKSKVSRIVKAQQMIDQVFNEGEGL